MEIVRPTGIDVPQRAEAGKAGMRERIEAASEGYPLTRLFLANPTLPSGLNLRDYYEVQNFPSYSWQLFSDKHANAQRSLPRNARTRPTFADYAKEDIRKYIGDVSIGKQKIKTVGNLWEKYVESRANLVEIFSTGEFEMGPRFEDIIMIHKLFNYGLLDGNMKAKEAKNTPMLQIMQKVIPGSLTTILHDIASFSYALPADKETEDFLINVSDNVKYDTIGFSRISYRPELGETEDFLAEKAKRGDSQGYDRFKQRFDRYAVPEFEERYMGKLMRELGGCKWENQQDRKTLLALGIPEAIIAIDNAPAKTLNMLQDTLKNSLGSQVTMMHENMQREAMMAERDRQS
jgi:hypothetical protein